MVAAACTVKVMNRGTPFRGSSLWSRRLLLAVTLLLPLCATTTGDAIAATASSSTLPTCQKLSVSNGAGVSPVTQELVLTFRLHNQGSKSCELDGYPALRILNSTRRVLPFTYTHYPPGPFDVTTAPPHRVTLPPHSSAFFEVNKVTCPTSGGGVAGSLWITVPKVRTSLHLSLPREPHVAYCLGATNAVFNRVMVTAIEPSIARLYGHA